MYFSTQSLKGTVSQNFLFQVFSWITFPHAPENNIRVISNFFENSRRSQVKLHHRVPISLTRVANLPLVSTTPVSNFATSFANLPLVSMIPAANLLPLSTTPVANCQWYQRHRWQIMGTISGCRHLNVNLKAKIYIYVNSKGVQTK
jgi:hypothetical protein